MMDHSAGSDVDVGETDDALERKLCFDVYATNLAFARVYAPLLEPHRLTYPQYLVLSLLWDTESRSMAEIGRSLHLRSNTLTPVLKRLESLGLLVRTRHVEDERRVEVNLTDDGRAMQSKLSDVPECVERATGLAVGEMRTLQQALRRVRTALMEHTPG